MSMSLEDILDPVLRAKVKHIISALPRSTDIADIRDALLECQGDVTLAVDILLGDVPDLEKKSDRIFNLAKAGLQEPLVDPENGPQHDSNVLSTTHINGKVKSIAAIDTKTNQTSISDKPTLHKNDIEKTKGVKTLETPDTAGEPHSPIKVKEEETEEIPALNQAGESSRPSVKLLYDLFDSRATEGECENALRVCHGNAEKACEILQKSYPFDHNSNDSHRSRKPTNCCSVSKKSVPDLHVTENRNCGKKRGLVTSDAYPSKRHKQESCGSDEESDDLEEETEESITLEPASAWVRKYFPGGENAIVLLGPKEEVRNTIPKKTLCENSTFFSDYYDMMEEEEWEDNTVELPDVDPQMFDLAVQCMVSKSFTLEPNPSRSKSSEITILLDLVSLTAMLGLPNPSAPVIEKLRDILVEERRALRRKHIRRAFELDEGQDIQELFVKAVVGEYMRTRGSSSEEIDTEETDDDDDDDDESKHRDEAHCTFYGKHKFSFLKELSTIRDFKLQLLEEQDKVLNSGQKVLARSATRSRTAVYTTTYNDPLGGAGFSL